MSKAIPTLLAAFALLLAGCEADVEKEGELPSVDVDAESGQVPKYDVEQTQEGELPSVDVDAEPGRLPEVEVRGPDVEVERDTVEVPVPDVDVEMPEEQGQ